MNKGKWLQPAQMFADRNSICTTFPDKSTNIKSVASSVTPWEPDLPLISHL